MTRSKAATERPGPPSRETAVRAPVTFIEPDQRAGEGHLHRGWEPDRLSVATSTPTSTPTV